MKPAPPVTRIFLTLFKSWGNAVTRCPISSRSKSVIVFTSAACFSRFIAIESSMESVQGDRDVAN